MEILGYNVTWNPTWRAKGAPLSGVPTAGAGFWGLIREGFAGAWQQGVEVDAPRNLLAFSAVFACVSIIARDIAKMRVKLTRLDPTHGIWQEVGLTPGDTSPFLKVLRKPNRYQNRVKFWTSYVVSLLLNGNAYVLKVRDGRGVVVELYVLDGTRVLPLVGSDGSVWYQLGRDDLSGVAGQVTVPASEIIHDLMCPLWHPLVGISPLYACAMSATQGNKIQANSATFFENMSRPSGILTAPGKISDETAGRLKTLWEENFRGSNMGRLAVLGDDLKYQAMTIPAAEAQLIEQLNWTVADVARAFLMPMWKLGGPMPANADVAANAQAYYSDCLQSIIESAELCLDEGLELPADLGVEFDLDGLIRMDPGKRYERHSNAIKGGWLAPDQARKAENMPPVPGGASPMAQQQNFSLAALAKRDARDDPFATAGGLTAGEVDRLRAFESGTAATHGLVRLAIEGQREIVETLNMPVEPEYDAAGKLKGARRKKPERRT